MHSKLPPDVRCAFRGTSVVLPAATSPTIDGRDGALTELIMRSARTALWVQPAAKLRLLSSSSQAHLPDPPLSLSATLRTHHRSTLITAMYAHPRWHTLVHCTLSQPVVPVMLIPTLKLPSPLQSISCVDW
jgi:hypothetical protein